MTVTHPATVRHPQAGDPLTVDRRQSPDRRQQRPGGRRASDPNPSHGTRAMYRRGCSCTPCRSANAAAEAQRRADRLAGRFTLGQRISPKEAIRRIRQLKAEHFSQYAMAKRLGLNDDHLRVHPTGITVRKLFKIRRLYRLVMAEGPDLPLDGPPI